MKWPLFNENMAHIFYLHKTQIKKVNPFMILSEIKFRSTFRTSLLVKCLNMPKQNLLQIKLLATNGTSCFMQRFHVTSQNAFVIKCLKAFRATIR